jgi:hypothetical protein
MSERMSEIIRILSFLRKSRIDPEARPLSRAFFWCKFPVCVILPLSKKEVAMTLYEQIKNRFQEQEAAQNMQLNLLARAAGNIASGFGNYLGTPDQLWKGTDGKSGRYVMLGTGNGTGFEEKRWMALTSTGGVVDFTIAVTVLGSDDAIPRCTLTFPISAKFCDQGYEFAVHYQNNVTPVIISPEEVKAGQFAALYNVLTERLLAYFDPAKVLIQN